MTISMKTWKRDALTIRHEDEWTELLKASIYNEEMWEAADRVGYLLEGLDDLRYAAMDRHEEIRGILRQITLEAA